MQIFVIDDRPSLSYKARPEVSFFFFLLSWIFTSTTPLSQTVAFPLLRGLTASCAAVTVSAAYIPAYTHTAPLLTHQQHFRKTGRLVWTRKTDGGIRDGELRKRDFPFLGVHIRWALIFSAFVCRRGCEAGWKSAAASFSSSAVTWFLPNKQAAVYFYMTFFTPIAALHSLLIILLKFFCKTVGWGIRMSHEKLGLIRGGSLILFVLF